MRPSTSADGLAQRASFMLGRACVVPATRTIEGPGGTVSVEPRVMQVLLLLADGGGVVVSRSELLAVGWEGRVVGDDALNRVISAVRRALRATDSGFEITTIAKTGYRLHRADDVSPSAAPAPSPLPSLPPPIPHDQRALPDPGGIAAPRRRRLMAAGVVGATCVLGGAGAWHAASSRDDAVAETIAAARQALRDDRADGHRQSMEALQAAVARAPRSAAAFGALALAASYVVEHAPVAEVGSAVRTCESAARRALALDSDQIDAQAALALLRPIFSDWWAAESRMNDVLRKDARHVETIAALGVLMYSVGRIEAAAACSSRAIALAPWSPVFLYRRAYHEWSLGQVGQADRTIDRALQLWPAHPGVWYARMLIFAFTERADAARALVANPANVPAGVPQGALRWWDTVLTALAGGSPEQRHTAVEACIEAANRGASGAANAILSLNGLGAVDEAFRVADGYLLRRGPLIGAPGPAVPGYGPVEQRWRKTMILFNPTTRPMRRDARFATLCRDMGMTAYWTSAGVRPDYLTRQLGDAPA